MKNIALILLVALPLFAFEKEPVKEPVNIQLKINLMVGDSVVSVDFNKFYFDQSVIIDQLYIPLDSLVHIKPDTVIDSIKVPEIVEIAVHDTVYLPELENGDRLVIRFDFQDDSKVRFACNFNGKQDTVQKFGMFPIYEQVDSLIHYERTWRYQVNLEAGQQSRFYELADGAIREKRWQMVRMQLQGYNFFGTPGIPSNPFQYIHSEWVNNKEESE